MEGEIVTSDGSGAVSTDLVLRFSAPGTLLASGHPKSGSGLPEIPGLIRSSDSGESWEAVSLPVKRTCTRSTCAAASSWVSRWRTRAARAGIFSSLDGTWRRRDVLPAAHLAWSERGPLFRVNGGGAVSTSADGGTSWSDTGDVGGSPTTITVDSMGRVYVAVAGGVIKRSTDGGRTFAPLARLSAP
jgi:photosystem II stability/assembly factor-like uncharacterized protein